MKTLHELIGEEIIAYIPMIDPIIFQSVRLYGVENGGVWIESQALTQTMLKAVKQSSSSKTPLFFVPFHEIKFLIQGTEKLALSEKAFGL